MTSARTRAMPIELSVTSDPRQMTVVRAVVAKASGLAGFTERDQAMVALAVDEVCTNIIKYSYRNDPTRPIRVRCVPGPSGIEIVIRDFGEKPREATLTPKRPGTTRLGGRGMHFLLSIMDKVVFDVSPTKGTISRLAKALPAPSAATEESATWHNPDTTTFIVRRAKDGKADAQVRPPAKPRRAAHPQ
ncbi:MAG: ATP-binding protein [Planctomycetes bacterium]|nr:ATP-binding protein [Planctomycetota bacterium]